MIKLFITALLLLGFNAVAAQENKPNIVVIFADDLGFGDVGAYRELYPGVDDKAQAYKHTPNIDSLAMQGVRFTRAYATSWCAPSRQVLLSGQWVGRADAYEHPWIGAQLRKAGYVTSMVGKSHGNMPTTKVFKNVNPQTAEFDDGLFFNGGMRSYYLKKGDTFPGRKGFKPFKFKAKGGEYVTDVFTDHAVGFIERNAKKPFMLYLPYTAPHTPLEAKPDDLKDLFPNTFAAMSEQQIMATAKKTGNRELMDKHYSAMVYGMDKSIGRIIETLRKEAVLENTIIVFTSDNGSRLGSNYPLAGHKWDGLEGGVRVPFIIWSNDIKLSKRSGAVFDGLVSLADISPTLVEAATGKYEQPTDGMALLSYIAQQKAWPAEREYLISNASRGPHLTGVAEFGGEQSIILQKHNDSRVMQHVYYKNDEKIMIWNPKGSDELGAVYRKIPDVNGNAQAQKLMKEKTPTANQVTDEKLLTDLVEKIKASKGTLLPNWTGGNEPDNKWWFMQ